MSKTIETTELYSTIEESATLLGIPCSRDKVWPIITAYEDVLAQASIAFRVATSARHAGELDCRFLQLPKELDPYAVALSNDLTPKTDHPAGSLVSEIHQGFPIDCSGIDFGVVRGFTKTWSAFAANDLQDLAKLAELPAMPSGLADHVSYFARHGVADKVGVIGIDYPSKTMNVYFGDPPAECFERKTILSMHREFGLPEPSEQMLQFGEKAFSFYATLSWDSPNIKRIAYAVMVPDPTAFPVPLDPATEQLVRNAPNASSGNPVLLYPATSAEGEYYKLQTYYRFSPQILEIMPGAE